MTLGLGRPLSFIHLSVVQGGHFYSLHAFKKKKQVAVHLGIRTGE